MINLSIALMVVSLLSFTFIIIGLFSPKVALFWYRRKGSRLASFTIYGAFCLLSFLGSIVAASYRSHTIEQVAETVKPDPCKMISLNELIDIYKIKSKDSLLLRVSDEGFLPNFGLSATDSQSSFLACPAISQDSTSYYRQIILTDTSGLFDTYLTYDKGQYLTLRNEILEKNVMKSQDGNLLSKDMQLKGYTAEQFSPKENKLSGLNYLFLVQPPDKNDPRGKYFLKITQVSKMLDM